MATPSYIIEFRRSAFMKALTAPLADDDAALLRAEDREARAARWHENWILANASIHEQQFDHWQRLHNTFYGDKTVQESEAIRSKRNRAIERLVFTPAQSQDHFRTKQVMARKRIAEKDWSAAWRTAMDEDAAYLASKKRRT